MNLGEQDKALNDFHIAIRLGQEVPAAHLGSAQAHFEKRDFKKAIIDFTQGISSLPDYMEANSGLFERLKQESQLEIYDIAIDVMTELYRGRGVCFLNLGEHQKAIEDFDAAINLNPNDADAYRGRGATYSQIKEHAQAVEDLDVVVRCDPDSANTFFTRGIVHFNKEDFDNALKDFDRAISIDANHANSYIGRGSCCLYLGRHHDALNDMDVAIDLLSSNSVAPEMDPLSIAIHPSYAYANRGLTYSMLGHGAAAKRDFNKAVALGFDYSQIEEDLRELEGMSKRAEGNFKITPRLNRRREDLSSHIMPTATTEKESTSLLRQTVLTRRDRNKRSIDRNARSNEQSDNMRAHIKSLNLSEDGLTSELQQAVLGILTDNLRPGSSEAEDPNKQHLPRQAVLNATLDSLQCFVDIHDAISAIVSPFHYRTRHAGRTSTEGIGLAFYTRPMGDGARVRGIQIQSILLPTRVNMSGCIEAYLRGHAHSPITAPLLSNGRVGDEIRDGRPVFRIIGPPSRELTQQVIDSFRRSSLFPQIQSD